MIKKTVHYTDYNDREREETLYFNLSRAEFDDINDEMPGGIQGVINGLADTNNIRGFIKTVKELVKKSYGVKSNDGKRIIKNQEILDEFVQSEAYSVVLDDVLGSVESMLVFLRGIFPTGHLTPAEKAKYDAQMDEVIAEAAALTANNNAPAVN